MSNILSKNIQNTLMAITILSLSMTAALAFHNKAEQPIAYIISPLDGATVSSTFTVQFGLKGMGVSPAGIERKHTGHHHLLVDAKQLPALDKPLGAEVTHFGGGQTQTQLTLPKGEHTLQLILGDHHHVPHSPAVVSKKITITVE